MVKVYVAIKRKLQVGDKYFDMSVSRDLIDIKNQFTKNIFVADI